MLQWITTKFVGQQPEEKLLAAASEGDVAAVRVLLENEAIDVEKRDKMVEVVTDPLFPTARGHKDGRTPLQVASAHGHLEVVDLLLKANSHVNVVDTSGETPLHEAADNRHLQVVELLLTANANVDAANLQGSTPLHLASWNGFSDVVEALLKANATVDKPDKFGLTPLHRASKRGNPGIVSLLLAANADPDAVDVDGRTPLHGASRSGNIKVVDMLLEADAAIDVSDTWGQTALHGACYKHRTRVVQRLLEAGANPHAKNCEGLGPFHKSITSRQHGTINSDALDTLKALVSFGVTWDTKCEELVASKMVMREAPAIRMCVDLWIEELDDGLPFTEVPIEVIRRGLESTKEYIDSLKSSSQIVLRRKICLVGPSCAGKTSFVKSITTNQPQLEHVDNRTIGIDHFPLRLEQYISSRDETKIHEVTFWDFAGQDAYQVAHSLFFSPRTLFLVCVDLEAFTVAYLQASIMSDFRKQERQLMDEFIEHTVMQWVWMIMARQPDVEFVFIATKTDLLKENTVTEQLLKSALEAKLVEVKIEAQEMRSKLKRTESSLTEVISAAKVATQSVMFVSCASSESVQQARDAVEAMIINSTYSFHMPDTYTNALETIIAMRAETKSLDITTRLDRVFARIEDLPVKLRLKSGACRQILQTLHDLGDVLWYEDLGVELFQDRVILEPLLLIDFIRQVINHESTGQVLPHADLKAQPYWVGLKDEKQMEAMKQLLQKFHLVYASDEDRSMTWDSDLIVPAYWQTKTPASWLFLGDILRINDTKKREGETVRVHWEYHFEFGLPSSLFDHVVVASISPYFSFDAGPDWILYEEKEFVACRVMVGRDPKTLHRTIHVEAVVGEAASTKQEAQMWGTFGQIVGAFIRVMREYPGLLVSSFAWDDAGRKVMLKRLVASQASPNALPWMPPPATWSRFQQLVTGGQK